MNTTISLSATTVKNIINSLAALDCETEYTTFEFYVDADGNALHLPISADNDEAYNYAYFEYEREGDEFVLTNPDTCVYFEGEDVEVSNIDEILYVEAKEEYSYGGYYGDPAFGSCTELNGQFYCA